MKSDITKKWKNETIKQAFISKDREAVKSMLMDEIWKYHELSSEFLKKFNIRVDEEKAINEFCMKSHNEVLEKLIKLL